MASCSALKLPYNHCRASRGPRAAAIARASSQQPDHAPAAAPGRRAWLAAGAAAALAPLLPAARLRPAAAEEVPAAAAAAPAVEVVADEPGSGSAAARQGDLVLVHYVGTVGGAVFDSTRGGQKYRDGGQGALRPAIIQLGGAPVPGICAGLQQGIAGMRVGGRRTFTVPPALGFGGQTVLAPYGVVPGGSALRYEVELLRLSRRGPDELMSGISQCGAGTASERTAGCAAIAPAEFV